MKVLREKYNQVFQAIIKIPNKFYLSYSFRLNQFNSFILLFLLKLLITYWKFKKQIIFTIEIIQKLNENNKLHTKSIVFGTDACPGVGRFFSPSSLWLRGKWTVHCLHLLPTHTAPWKSSFCCRDIMRRFWCYFFPITLLVQLEPILSF
jgi:hypothetical protein